MHEQGDHGELHLAGADLSAEIFGRAADHHAGDEHADDQEDEHVDHADAFAAEHAVQPHADHRRNAAIGLRLSISALIAPQVTSMVIAANVAPAEVPKRSSLPSRLPRC